MSADKLQERYDLLAERRDLLKEYLLRPLHKAREESAGSLLSPEAIKKAQVLPDGLWRRMQGEYTKTERLLEAMRIRLSAKV